MNNPIADIFRRFPQLNVSEVAVPDIAQFEIQPGDRIFLCSDGLYKCIPPYILKKRLMDDKTPEEILDVFDFLCGRSGDDNYTAIMVRID